MSNCMKCGGNLWGSNESAECVNERCGGVEPIPVPLVWGLAQSMEDFFGLKKDQPLPNGHWRAIAISDKGPVWARVDKNEQKDFSNNKENA